MVGVAGKSQACNTCRERRVKCDLSRPSCLKCISSKRTCAGYGRDLIFVNRTPSRPASTATSVLSELKAQQQLKNNLATSKTEAELHRLFFNSSQNCQEFRKYAVELLKATYLPKQSASNSPKGETSDGSYSWAYSLTDLVEPSKSLDTSIFAFCLAQLHITATGNVSLYQCLDQYNIALQQLYSDLGVPGRQLREETLAAILVLSTCELFISKGNNGWSIHAHGLTEILRLRDPGMTITPAWRHLLSRLRIICVLEALTNRQAQFLKIDTWGQIITDPRSSDALNEVYQMIIDVPFILEKAVALPSIDDSSILLKESIALMQSIFAILQAIRSWNDDFWNVSPTPRFWLVPSRVTNPADVDSSNKIFPFCFEFSSINVAVAIVMSWSVVTQLYSNIIQIYDLVQARLGRSVELDDTLAHADPFSVDIPTMLGPPGGKTEGSTTDKGRSIQEIQEEGTRMVRYVCQSLEYHHRIEMGTYGGHATTYACWSARQYFRLHSGHERERLWLQNIHKTKGPGTQWGLSMMTFVDIADPLGSSPTKQL
ncbi:hypothetical protein BGW36DRAFT_425775 [Talaromyces proteolyticus]|uniref:Zn(2)-C6 fungal-type domain-containing protein n=1 Tax=Talaromyces proteolyticus TaxID=1131652 RepID=A0AAD4KVX8_9EURO|nr:uncharacterized protein BGW36DRAFT_425775 [Talaromyces proteolyticus]KAH8700975.1 hypothetical protein BGW36DRAFT_425775 [Talaromyces proteolyticus]